ncbi:MAG TPA: thioredoxin family protein [Burkholderiales bacterium]|nr:thioredoxin family protein [Burkholderiales bacterium]
MRRAVLGFCAAILACTLSPPVAAQAIDTAQDLARSAREATAAGVPLLVFFSQPGCPYCDLARQNYLGPMNAVPAARKTVRMVEVDITSESPLVDFGGRATTHRAFALAQKVRFVPVVKFLGARGEPLAPALIGLTVPGFYQSYLDRRIEQAQARLAAPAQ